MDGDSEPRVAGRLNQMGYIPVVIQPAQEDSILNTISDRLRRIGHSDLNMFTRQLYTLQKAGLPLLSSLEALHEQVQNRQMKAVIAQMTRDIEAGSDLSGTMQKFPQIFDALYVNMIRSGEASGRLAEILERLAVLGEHDEKIRLRIKAATRYPIIVVAAIVIAFLVLITFVVPRFAKLYGQFKTELPLATKMLIAVHYAVTHFWWALLILIVAAIFVWRQLIKTKKGLLWWDSLKLKVPVLGPLLLNLMMSRFCRTVGSLMRSGLPILQILDLTADSVGNVVVSRAIHNIKFSVNEGKGMSEPMKMSGLFPPVVTQMVAVGEDTGKVDELLLHVADYYDSEIDYTINNLVTLIEPFLILVLGIVVLFLALGIFTPMWNIIHLFRKS
jgi:type II secretory pathway component PulF